MIYTLGGSVGPSDQVIPIEKLAGPLGDEGIQSVLATRPSSMPVPDGLTLDQVEAMLRTLAIDDAPAESLRGYVDDSFWRFLLTWDLVKSLEGRALELGSNPYFTTVLMDRWTGLDLTLANYFGPTGVGLGAQAVTYTAPDGSSVDRTFSFDHFDVEHDPFPYPDSSFDTVLFCEILEHLLEDPVATISEINRVLVSDGTLVVTTPNVARLENVLRLVDGANLYDPYSGFGPYGRHNREYTLHDLAIILSFCGFELERAFTSDAHRWSIADRTTLDTVAPLVEHRRNDLGQYLFVVARKIGPPQSGRPSWLYRSLPEHQLVDWSLPG